MSSPTLPIDSLLMPVAALLLIGAYSIRVSKRDGIALTVAVFRMVLQLATVALVLQAVFDGAGVLSVGGLTLLMSLLAAREVIARQGRNVARSTKWVVGPIPLIGSSVLFTCLAVFTTWGKAPWSTPQMLLPTFGMLLGNSLTAVAVTVNLVQQYAADRYALIETRLALGQTASEAVSDVRRDALKIGLFVPLTNMLAASGIVMLPGVMTGQILGGIDPVEAAKYQIFILLLVACAAATASFLAAHLSAQALFDSRQRLAVPARLF